MEITVNAYAPGPINTEFREPTHPNGQICFTINRSVVGKFDDFHTSLSGAPKGSFLEGVRTIDIILRITNQLAMQLKDKNSTRSIGEPEDVANLVSYLASKSADYCYRSILNSLLTVTIAE